MDPLIESYINIHYTYELQTEIVRAFHFFDEFNFVDYELAYIDLLTAEDLIEPDSIHARFLEIVRQQQETIFNAHLLTIHFDSTLHERNELLEFLYRIQHLDSYQELDIVAHSDQDKEHITAELCEKLSALSLHRALELIENIDGLAFEQLKNYIHQQHQQRNPTLRRYSEEGQAIVKNMRALIAFLQQDNLIGVQLMDAGVLINQPYSRYKQILGEDDLFANMSAKDIAANMLSFIYLAQEGIDKPLETYRTVASLFLTSLTDIASVEHELNQLVAEFVTYIKAEHEKERLLQASHSKP